MGAAGFWGGPVRGEVAVGARDGIRVELSLHNGSLCLRSASAPRSGQWSSVPVGVLA
eukprot:SAG11_NODE_31792_length_289_cov_0.736842_1_plen_56_part_10